MDIILTFEQLRLIVVVYLSSIIPLILIPIFYFMRKIPSWVPFIYFITILLCAIGWEIWFTYGLIDGDNVNLRRASVLSLIIPIHLNWLLNSLADAGTICLGGLYLSWLVLKKNNNIFYKWNWKCFFILLTFNIFQNIFVEMYLYHDQLNIGKPLSWAPMSPLGPWINPKLFIFNDRTIFFQNQVPWFIMTPIFYKLLTSYNTKNS